MPKDHKYKGVIIHYDEKGIYPIGFYDLHHWYVSITHSLENGYKRVTREYFKTLAETKKFIAGY